MIANHIIDMQRFHADGLVFAHQRGCLLLKEVRSLIGNLFMHPCKADTLFVSVFTALFFTGQFALLSFELLLGFTEMFWVFHFVSITVFVEDFNALHQFRLFRLYLASVLPLF